MAVVYLGLGSNIGDREQHLVRACGLLHQHPAIAVQAVSSLYETAPVGLTAQVAFLNAVARVHTTLGPESLLAITQAVESRLGREPAIRWGPRVIDVDILLYDALEVHKPFLDIPHKALSERLFVLVPLSELEPDLHLPSGEPIRHIIVALPDQGDVTHLGPFPPFADGNRS
jgi:2-amino-4-hydroxy-6-hydroxymethyldihydropteridine diphosphokinase